MLAWHFTKGDRLRDGRPVPPIGETLKHRGPLKLCESGLHASVRLIDALTYAPGVTLHRVECGGERIEGNDKLVCRERTIVASADMTWALVEFAEDCAKRAAHAAAHAAAAAAAYADIAYAAAARAARARVRVRAARVRVRPDAYHAAAAACAAAAHAAHAAACAANDDAAEREHQNSTLELWFECMKGHPNTGCGSSGCG